MQRLIKPFSHPFCSFHSYSWSWSFYCITFFAETFTKSSGFHLPYNAQAIIILYRLRGPNKTRITQQPPFYSNIGGGQIHARGYLRGYSRTIHWIQSVLTRGSYYTLCQLAHFSFSRLQLPVYISLFKNILQTLPLVWKNQS